MKIILNNIDSQIVYDNTDPSDMHKILRDYLKVFVQGAEHSEKYQSGVWDGYKYFITDVGKKFQTGLLPMILKFLGKYDINIIFEDKRTNLLKFKELTVTEGNIVLFDYQIPFIEKSNNFLTYKEQKIYFPRGVWNAATNAGKTIMSLLLVKNIENAKVLFLVQDMDLFIQTYNFFSQFMEVGMIKSTFTKTKINKAEFTVKDFTIAMTKTLNIRLSPKSKDRLHYLALLKDVNVLIVDECHEAVNDTHKGVAKYINAGLRYYISGTPYVNLTAVKKLELTGLCGMQLHKVTNEELINYSVSAEPYIDIYLNCVKLSNLNGDYRKISDVLIRNSIERNSKIAQMAYEDAKKGKYVLVTFIEILHGEAMFAEFQKINDGIPVAIVHGGDSERNPKIEAFKNKEIKVLFSSIIMKKGLNIPHLGTLILGSAGKSKADVKQWIGRLLRLSEFLNTVRVIDFYDIGKYVEEHSKERLELYESEGFKVNKHYSQFEVNKITNFN